MESSSKSLLGFLNEQANFFVQEYSLTDCNANPESLSEVNMTIRILNKNLISPVYSADTNIKSILYKLIIQHYTKIVDREIDYLKDDLIDSGKLELTDEEENIERIRRQQDYLIAFEKDPSILKFKDIWESININKELNINNDDSITREGLVSFLNQNEFLERGYNTIVQTILSSLTQHDINYTYKNNNTYGRELTIKRSTITNSKVNANESFELIVSVIFDDKSGENGIFFRIKIRLLKESQEIPQKLMSCINDIVNTIGKQNADPAFATFSRRRSTVRVDVDSSFSEDLFSSIETKNEVSPVTCSVYAPAKVKRAETILVQVFAHSPENIEEAEEMALAFDDTSSKRAQKRLTKEIAVGSTLHFSLSIAGLEIDNGEEELIWSNETESVQFMVEIPNDFEKSNLIGKVVVSQDSIPIGHMLFKMDIDEKIGKNEAPVKSEMKQYSHAFISYASDDRDEVLRRVQMLQSVNISFFQDILNLNPGDNWEDELYRQIDKSDFFFLFWSVSAKESEWVMKEVEYALKKAAKQNTPEIIPIILHAPPVVTPPESLKHIHFNDRLAYFIQNESANNTGARAKSLHI